MNLRVRRVTGVSAILVVSGDAGSRMSVNGLSIFVCVSRLRTRLVCFGKCLGQVDHGAADLSVDKCLSTPIAAYRYPLINIYNFIASMSSVCLFSSQKTRFKIETGNGTAKTDLWRNYCLFYWMS